ncbi:MAG: S8 family peptidase [Oligoflexia bacterium]|nr:S8 family peptidase [Oligoflexia bacterium]
MRKTSPKISILLLTLGSFTLFGFVSPEAAGVHQRFAFASQLKNWGLINDSSEKSDIRAVDAWRLQEGSAKIVVAVIDTGLDATHRDLTKNVWHDPNSPSIYGWNFVVDHANPIDDHGHGTHIAGIIGAVADPQNGVSGVAHHVSIMPVKYYSDANPGSVNLRNTVAAINYAVEHGARIINYSGGGPEFSEDEYLAIKKAEARGVLFVAAAGNEHQDTDLSENYYYPAAYRLSNIISVAATDIRNTILPSSNWGHKRVDIAAPGENIYSTLPGGRYGYMTGTSQATAFVTGVAALLLSQDPTLTPQEIREIITASADSIDSLRDKVASGGKVNAYQALLLLADSHHNSNRHSVRNLIASRASASKPRIPDPSSEEASSSLFHLWE